MNDFMGSGLITGGLSAAYEKRIPPSISQYGLAAG
jgi:hypothetical protein